MYKMHNLVLFMCCWKMSVWWQWRPELCLQNTKNEHW